MNRAALTCRILVTLAILANTGYSQLTPGNSWRALVVYSNSIDSIYGGTNMYNAYFASLVDAMNQVYEESGVDIRAQLAGVVWDKAYTRSSPSTGTVDDLYFKANGMQRWTSDSVLNKYAVDMVILVHNPTDTYAGGAAFTRFMTISKGYAGFWMRYPDNLELLAHEGGHIYSTAGNYDHCIGHRMAFDISGNVMGGPSPDSIPYTITISPTVGVPTGIIVTTPWTVHHGFYSAPAYADGGSQYCYTDFGPHTHSGNTATFRTYHQGTPGPAEWTGTYSNLLRTWTDSITNIPYPTGYDSVTYLNHIKYLDDGTDTVSAPRTYFRNFAAILDSNKSLVTDLRGIPSGIVITSDMSLGPNAADSQWMYAYFSATDSVIIRSGFSVTGDASVKISVGSDPAPFAKRGPVLPKQEIAKIAGAAKSSFRLQGVNVAFLMLTSDARVTLDAFTLDGRHAATLLSENLPVGSHMRTLKVSSLAHGLYIYRLKAGNLVETRKVMVGR